MVLVVSNTLLTLGNNKTSLLLKPHRLEQLALFITAPKQIKVVGFFFFFKELLNSSYVKLLLQGGVSLYVRERER